MSATIYVTYRQPANLKCLMIKLDCSLQGPNIKCYYNHPTLFLSTTIKYHFPQTGLNMLVYGLKNSCLAVLVGDNDPIEKALNLLYALGP